MILASILILYMVFVLTCGAFIGFAVCYSLAEKHLGPRDDR